MFKKFQIHNYLKMCTNVNDITLSKSKCLSGEMLDMKIKNNLQYIDVCTKLFNIHLLDLKTSYLGRIFL